MKSMRRRARILREGTRLSHIGDRLDQCLEQVRRRLSLDPTGAEAGCRSGGLVGVNIGEFEAVGFVESRLANRAWFRAAISLEFGADTRRSPGFVFLSPPQGRKACRATIQSVLVGSLSFAGPAVVPCRHPQIGISSLRCGTAPRPSTIAAIAAAENTPLLFLARAVKSTGLRFSLLVVGVAPLPSAPWHSAHFDRNSVRPLSRS